ncbi:hypothetical protein [Pseudonocardia parietis]|uniref:Uncharacterized membrane protein YidH (DUF202 family) n=1 Tax=Pseudonocardia parietis TaxID=570936 RepID=A0ABS4VNR0_9PSEU|nr:hypothetical protein [Pseudonocardia parietis]MBP2365393.1 uncharacterized membrane protein YidH (DUF202 family) [Pseudonocardia parietis]
MTDSSRATVLGLVADPGLSRELALRLVRDLPEALERNGDGRWEVQLSDEHIALDQQGALPMLEIGRRARERDGTDAVVLITDLPRRAGSLPIVADGGSAARVGLVSLPALGGIDQYRRCRDTIVRLVTRHLFPAEDRSSVGESADAGRAGSLTRLEPANGTDDDSDDDSGTAGVEDEVDVRLALTGVRGRLRLLGGIVRANRPWRLVPSLSPALAAAAAGAAFGIFYSNIWQLATALGTGRQVTVMLLALVAMTAWLIGNNGLWESRRSRSLREEMVLSNLSTVLTVACGVLIMFALLFALTLVAAALVIPPHYLGSQLMREAGFDDYVMIAWLSTSMGTVAGALGSGFADESAVRQAAYSRRERERRARLDREDERSADQD